MVRLGGSGIAGPQGPFQDRGAQPAGDATDQQKMMRPETVMRFRPPGGGALKVPVLPRDLKSGSTCRLFPLRPLS
jgi:hypothetical protein